MAGQGLEWKTRRQDWLGEESLETKLGCGLEAFLARKPGFQRKTAVLTVKFGSLDSAFETAEGARRSVTAGTAHFLEHRLFQSEDGDVSEKLAALGASSNAATSYNSTSYFFSCVDGFFEALDLLLGFLDGLHVTPEMADREREIIAEELRGCQDNPSFAGFQKMMSCLYRVSPAREDIGGTLESIREIDVAALEAAYHAFYTPSNCLLVAGGDIDPARMLDELARFDSRARRAAPPARLSPSEPEGVAFRSALVPMLVSQPKLILAFKDAPSSENGLSGLRRHTEISVALSALFGRGSDFYRDAYESGLMEDTFGFQVHFEPGIGHSALTADTDRPEELAAALMAAIERARTDGILRADFDRIMKRVRGRFVRNFNYPDNVVFAMSSYLLRGLNLLDVPDVFDSMTHESAQRSVAAHLDAARHARVLVAPGPRPGLPGREPEEQ